MVVDELLSAEQPPLWIYHGSPAGHAELIQANSASGPARRSRAEVDGTGAQLPRDPVIPIRLPGDGNGTAAQRGAAEAGVSHTPDAYAIWIGILKALFPPRKPSQRAEPAMERRRGYA
jgi:hypothetical protein